MQRPGEKKSGGEIRKEVEEREEEMKKRRRQ
jgi:hypothetical protein